MFTVPPAWAEACGGCPTRGVCPPSGAMKLLTASRTLNIPAGVTVEIKARAVRVQWPRGMLQKDF